MNRIATWNHRWFGIWKETDPRYHDCPSIQDFINREVAARLDKNAISNYLENAHIVATTSRVNFPCTVTGMHFSGSISYRTDGVWLWLDDLGYYVREHDVCIPNGMIKTMEQNSFVPPKVSDEEIQNLEWPPIG